jgi:hypothetical protein
MRAGVDATIAGLPLTPADEALVALVRAYADEIDERARVARYAAAAIRAFDRDPDEHPVEVGEALGALRAKLAERETLDRLGARLHAGLVELGASPRARAKGEAPRALPSGPTRLSGLRAAAGPA